MINDKKKHSFCDIFISVIIAFIPISYLFALFGGISAGEVFTIIGLFLILIFKNRLRIKKKSMLFLTFFCVIALYNMFASGINGFDMQQALNNSIMVLLFGLEMSLISNYDIDIDKLYVVGRIFAGVLVGFLIIQLVAYYVVGTVVSGNMFGLETMDNYFVSETYGRPSAFLAEPAHFAIYLIPVYVTAFLKKDFKIIIICGLGLLLSTSSTGLIVAVVVPFIYYLYTLNASLLKKIILCITFAVFLIIGYSFVTNNYYDNYMNKLSIEALSENIRIVGQLDNMKKLDFSQWIFGIGLNNFKTFLSFQSIESTNYANSFFYALISFGLVGTVMLLYGFLKMCNISRLGEYRRIMILLVIIVCMILLSDQLLFNRNLLYIITWLYVLSRSLRYRTYRQIS